MKDTARAVRLGFFIVAMLAGAAGAVFLIGSKHLLFTHTYRLYAEFDNVAGLTSGAGVRVAGMQEGNVKHVYLPQRSGDKVRVEMDLNTETNRVVKKDSVAAIHTEGIVGDQYVEITEGSPAAPMVRDGDTIRSQPPIQISDLLKKADSLLDTANSAVGTAKTALGTANTALHTINQTAGNLDSITGKVNRGQGTIGQLINNGDAYRHIDAASSELQEDMEALKHNFLTSHFFKKRGYEDASDLTQYTIGSLPRGNAQQRFDIPGAKLFDKDSAKLKKKKLLDDAGQYLQNNKFGLVVVTVSAGPTGDTDKDRQLALARAYTAREYLVDKFKIDDTHVKTFGLGKSADAPNGGDVSILVYPQAQAETPQGTADRLKQAGHPQ